MACERVSLPGGGHAIVCGTRASRGQRAQDRCACGKPATRLCDWKLQPSSSEAVGQQKRTCDAPLCAACATSPAPEKDLCPTHAAAFEAWRNERRITA